MTKIKKWMVEGAEVLTPNGNGVIAKIIDETVFVALYYSDLSTSFDPDDIMMHPDYKNKLDKEYFDNVLASQTQEFKKDVFSFMIDEPKKTVNIEYTEYQKKFLDMFAASALSGMIKYNMTDSAIDTICQQSYVVALKMLKARKEFLNKGREVLNGK